MMNIEVQHPMKELSALPPEAVIFGVSTAMQEIRATVEKICGVREPILIQGESGSGKETLARIIHRHYPGEEKPFFKIAAPRRRGGLLEDLASRSAQLPPYAGDGMDSADTDCAGTLLFRGVSDFRLSAQRELMELLQEDLSSAGRPSLDGCGNFRVICTSTAPLEQEVEAGNFLREVFLCLNVIRLHVPPLRERRADIPALVSYLFELYNRKFGALAHEPSMELVDFLQHWDWKGNIRELANVIKRYAILDSGEAIIAEMAANESNPFPFSGSAGGTLSLKQFSRRATQELERKIILRTLRDHQWNRRQAARALNISYRSMLYKAKEAGVPSKRLQSGEVHVGLIKD